MEGAKNDEGRRGPARGQMWKSCDGGERQAMEELALSTFSAWTWVRDDCLRDFTSFIVEVLPALNGALLLPALDCLHFLACPHLNCVCGALVALKTTLVPRFYFNRLSRSLS